MTSSTTNYVAAFPQQGRDITFEVISHLDYPDLLTFFCVCKDAHILKEKAERSLFSRIAIFDRTHWKEYWGVDITDQYDADKIEITILRTFLKTYYGSNPSGIGRVKDACLMPAVVPPEFGLIALGEVAEKPKKGYAIEYFDKNSVALKQHGATGAPVAKLVILLKGVVARGLLWWDQTQFLYRLNTNTHYGCEISPDAISQNIVLLAHHAVTGEFPFRDQEKRTNARTRELVLYWLKYYMISGDYSNTNPQKFAISDPFAPFDSTTVGVVVMKKF